MWSILNDIIIFHGNSISLRILHHTDDDDDDDDDAVIASLIALTKKMALNHLHCGKGNDDVSCKDCYCWSMPICFCHPL